MPQAAASAGRTSGAQDRARSSISRTIPWPSASEALRSPQAGSARLARSGVVAQREQPPAARAEPTQEYPRIPPEQLARPDALGVGRLAWRDTVLSPGVSRVNGVVSFARAAPPASLIFRAPIGAWLFEIPIELTASVPSLEAWESQPAASGEGLRAAAGH
jgi:hypothetical protein